MKEKGKNIRSTFSRMAKTLGKKHNTGGMTSKPLKTKCSYKHKKMNSMKSGQ